MRTRSNSYGKKKIKVKDDDFDVLSSHKYLEFLDYDYNVKQLRSIIKEYNVINKDTKSKSFSLKMSGNKNELKSRIYEYMRTTYFSIIIQKNFRSYIMKKFYSIFKGSYIKNVTYNNDTDFYTMDKIVNIPTLHLYVYQDEKKFNYVFRITSLIKQFDEDFMQNPYNRNDFSKKVLSDIKFIKIMYNIYSDLCEITESEPTILSRKQKIISGFREIFHKIDLLGNYTNVKWILDLNRRELTIFIKEIYDIWSYRAQLTDEYKREICPPTGNPFNNISIGNIHRHLEHNYLFETVLNIMKNMINTNSSDSNKSLCALYILSTLTLVSESAADAMPWLYQSVLN